MADVTTWEEVGRDANFEIRCLAVELRKLTDSSNTGAGEAAVARGMLRRVVELSDIVFDAFVQDDNDGRDLREASRRLYSTD